jgi:hypothetical protein
MHVRCTNSSVGSALIPSGDIRDISESSLLQAGVLSTEMSDSNIGNIMDCHVHSHSNTAESVQLSDGHVRPIIDTHHSLVLLLVELAVILKNSVLGIPAISQPGQEVVKNSREPRHIMSPSLEYNLPCGTHLK